MRLGYLAVPLIVLFHAAVAHARVEESISYTKQQSYNAALRFLRVDRGYKLVEKDVDSGYLLFEYPISGTSDVTNGSIEIIERKEGISLVVQLPQMPRYHERMLASGLLKKLQDDYGSPPVAKKPTQPEGHSPKGGASKGEPKEEKPGEGPPPESSPDKPQK